MASGPRRYSFELTEVSEAPPEAVFDLLADGANWASWAGRMVGSSSWERPAGTAPGAEPGGVGAVRKLGRGVVTREEIVESDRPRRHAYRVLSGLPVRDYLAVVDLAPLPNGGTTIVWSGSFVPTVPGTGALLRVGVARVVRSLARHLATAASKPPPVS